MGKVKFHLVLKKAISPEYFIITRLKKVLEPHLTETEGDLDWDDVKNSIEIGYFTSYKSTEKLLLGFTIDFSFAVRHLSNVPQFIREVGAEFRDEKEYVEGVFRYEDELMLEELLKFHKEIYAIEMQIREVINYILAYNFSRKLSLFEFREEFHEIPFSNNLLKNDVEKTNSMFEEYMEGEIFHISFTKYGQFKQPNKLGPDRIFSIIKEAKSFEDLQSYLNEQRGITEKINPNHKSFVENLATKLSPLEKVRNDVMHNRSIRKGENEYSKAKEAVIKLIEDFWTDERSKTVPVLGQANYLLDILIISIKLVDSGIEYTDLEKETQKAEDEENLITQLIEIITSNLYKQELTEEDKQKLKECIEKELKNKKVEP